MKKLYLFVSLLFMSLHTLWAWDNHILISTPRTSLLLYAEKGNSLRFQYLGDKITSGQIPHIYSSGNGLTGLLILCSEQVAHKHLLCRWNMQTEIGPWIW